MDPVGGSYYIDCHLKIDGVDEKSYKFPYHLDRDWSQRPECIGQWTYSEHCGGKYVDRGLMEERHLHCLLRHFGLVGYEHCPPFEEVRRMSPFDLLELRRRREREEGIKVIYPQSDRVYVVSLKNWEK